jgi:hypothetical protein
VATAPGARVSPLPPWRRSDLPHPPAFTLGNAVRVIGPGTLLLGVSLGAGDWLLGPAVTVTYGAALLWLCTISVILQAVLNTEMARYTLATGEPIFTGFMRTPPGARFWGWSYALLHLVQVAWPGWALAAGSALAALCLGRMPRAEDHAVVLTLGYLVFLGSIGIVLLSERVQRRVERAELIMMGWTVAFLLTVALMLVPWSTWTRIAGGFVSPLLGAAAFPADADWLLLAAFAAYSGPGGIINATLTHWLRDKGFGMAGALGSVAVVIGRQRILLAREGALFEPTAANLAKWREWWRYLRTDLCWLWMAGCLVGMGLPALLALEFLPRSAPMRGDAAGAVLAGALGEQYAVLWVPALVTAFWILFSTQLGIAAGFVRSVTDVVWTSGAGDGRRRAALIYYGALVVFTAAGLFAFTLAEPLALILIGANLAAVNFAVLAFHTLWVNRTLLPRELRPPLWRQAALLVCGCFFAGLACAALGDPSRVLALFAR